ncbi:MAG: ATP-NAD kinase family protein [Kangiellaceae bacterium]|jgi:predicted polyphosphate/ATP-dependent NAD kinase|nr:ATP-NAD kinase family protein [Kangiellaceae bacterium]
MFKLGLIVNPFAGIGGSVALKGSDGNEIRQLALAKGAEQLAPVRASQALSFIDPKWHKDIELVTASGDMGETAAVEFAFNTTVIADISQPSDASDTQRMTQALVDYGVDLIIFAGGDGTARDILSALDGETPVLGIPAGCKIHSGVYAITPKAAGELVNQLLAGEVVSLTEASVMDIDEVAFRDGTVRAKQFGQLAIPNALQYVQATKQGGKEVEAIVLDDIAADVIENMEPDVTYVIGSGSTCAVIMQQLGLPNTLLGVDVIKNNQVVINDATAKDLEQLSREHSPVELVITLIGGQGHLLGRGNQQLSRSFINSIGWENVHVVATKSKLKALNGRPLIVDSGDPEFDQTLAGLKKVITGYHDSVLYRVG